MTNTQSIPFVDQRQAQESSQNLISSAARTFSKCLVDIWDTVSEYKRRGVIATQGDDFWIAYRSAEEKLRNMCEENALLKQSNEQLEQSNTQLRARLLAPENLKKEVGLK